MLVGNARPEVDSALLSEVLPLIETAIVGSHLDDGGDGGES